MKVAITGSRSEQYASKIAGYISEALSELPPGSEVILGDATGVDAMARLICDMQKIDYLIERADWNTFGKAAGPIRNKAMLDHGPDEVWWFSPSLAESKGTRNCVEQARERGIPTRGWEHP